MPGVALLHVPQAEAHRRGRRGRLRPGDQPLLHIPGTAGVGAPAGDFTETSETRHFGYCLAHRDENCGTSPATCAVATYVESPRAPNAPHVPALTTGDLPSHHFVATDLCVGADAEVTLTIDVYGDANPPDPDLEIWEEPILEPPDPTTGSRKCYDTANKTWKDDWFLDPADEAWRDPPGAWCGIPQRVPADFGEEHGTDPHWKRIWQQYATGELNTTEGGYWTGRRVRPGRLEGLLEFELPSPAGRRNNGTGSTRTGSRGVSAPGPQTRGWGGTGSGAARFSSDPRGLAGRTPRTGDSDPAGAELTEAGPTRVPISSRWVGRSSRRTGRFAKVPGLASSPCGGRTWGRPTGLRAPAAARAPTRTTGRVPIPTARPCGTAAISSISATGGTSVSWTLSRASGKRSATSGCRRFPAGTRCASRWAPPSVPMLALAGDVPQRDTIVTREICEDVVKPDPDDPVGTICETVDVMWNNPDAFVYDDLIWVEGFHVGAW